jgi:ribosomal protein S18 acetylase RimI-like enzyme
METVVREATLQDAESVGEVIGAAFADDPVNRWVFGAGAMSPTFAALARHLYLQRGFGHLSSGARGAALWLSDARAKEAGLWRTLRVASVMARTAGFGAMRRGLAIDTAFTRAHPAEPHAFLFAIGVVPSAQGKGVGGDLLRAGLMRVDAARLPCYLESTKEANVALYRHFGFELLPTMPLPAGCPPIWPMWRPARS